MNYTEIVKKLIGEIQPTGLSHVDRHRLESLKAMCELVNNLVIEIDKVSHENKERQEHSMKEMGKYADHFLTHTLGIIE